MAFKIALTAGHYKYTSGKRCLKSLDPKETREWELNDRIADLIEKGLQAYTGWELLRTDDTTGEKKIELKQRTDAANAFGADFYLSIHHNAGINGGKGGGIVAYIYPGAGKETEEWQRELYNAVVAATGLKGNRSEPLKTANLHEVRETKMPAVLLELGFMDSATDVPIILSETYAKQCAEAIVGVLVKRGGLKKKATAQASTPGRYNTLAEVPAYARDTIRLLIDKGLLKGSGKKDANGDPADLDLSLDMIRLLVINHRAGCYQ